MKEEILEKYYNTFRYLRVAQEATRDIEDISDVMEFFEREEAVDVCSQLAIKYEGPINRIGNIFSGLHIIKDMSLYILKNDEQLLNDLDYIRSCIIIYATVLTGIQPDYRTCIRSVL